MDQECVINNPPIKSLASQERLISMKIQVLVPIFIYLLCLCTNYTMADIMPKTLIVLSL